MSTRVLVLGLDAADATLLRAGVDDGTLPTFARLCSGAAELELENTLSTLPGAIWPEIATGRSSGKTGFYFPPRQLRTGEAVPRPVEAHEVDPTSFWTLASDASARVAVVDYPWWPLKRDLNGIQLAEWGTHDRPFGTGGLAFSEPPQLASELTARYGVYPMTADGLIGSGTRAPCDGHDASSAGYEALLAHLLTGIELKTQLLVDLLQAEDWDLFVTVFGEPQCVGHQMWHLLELASDHESGRPTDPVREVYRRLDRATAEILEAAGADAVSVVIASHGMARTYGGTSAHPGGSAPSRSRLWAWRNGGRARASAWPGQEAGADDAEGQPSATGSRGRRLARASSGVTRDAGSGTRRRSMQLDQDQRQRSRAIRDGCAGPSPRAGRGDTPRAPRPRRSSNGRAHRGDGVDLQ